MITRSSALPRTTESAESAALWAWRDTLRGQWHALNLLWHIPNEGKRNPRRVASMGIIAGIPDVILPVARGDWTGLALELKAGAGKPTPAQDVMLDALRAEGWKAHVVTFQRPGDWVLAASIIASYLGMPETTVPV